MQIRLSPLVLKELKKIKQKDQKLTKKIEKQLLLFQSNPKHPSLRTHKLTGKQGEAWSISITMSIRMVYTISDEGIAHYQFVAIHPFIDGNGRSTRILTTLMLIQGGYDMTSFFALESYYNRNRKAYYEALNSVDKYRVEGKPDLTRWLEYYIEGMHIEAERAQSRIEGLQQKSKLLGNKVWLSEIQIKMLQLTADKQTAKTVDY